MTPAALETNKPPRPQYAPGAAVPDDETVAEMLCAIARVQAEGKTDLERLPKRLSPSRAADFKTCPYAFYLKTIVKISSPPTEATARGTVAHTAFERTFDHPAEERTPELAKSYVRPAWEEIVSPKLEEMNTRAANRARENAAVYRALAPEGSQTEAAILEFAEQMVDNWFAMERVANFNPAELTLPSGEVIDGRELSLGAHMFGVYLHGFIDRLDSWTTSNGRAYSVSDYKTGKVPGSGKSYSAETMARIEWDSFFQLRVYAVLAMEVHQIPVSLLRLVYVATGDREGGIKTLAVTRDVIERTKAEVRALWNQISRSAARETWQPRPGPLCNWCWYLSACPAYASPADTTGN